MGLIAAKLQIRILVGICRVCPLLASLCAQSVLRFSGCGKRTGAGADIAIAASGSPISAFAGMNPAADNGQLRFHQFVGLCTAGFAYGSKFRLAGIQASQHTAHTICFPLSSKMSLYCRHGGQAWPRSAGYRSPLKNAADRVHKIQNTQLCKAPAHISRAIKKFAGFSNGYGAGRIQGNGPSGGARGGGIAYSRPYSPKLQLTSALPSKVFFVLPTVISLAVFNLVAVAELPLQAKAVVAAPPALEEPA